MASSYPSVTSRNSSASSRDPTYHSSTSYGQAQTKEYRSLQSKDYTASSTYRGGVAVHNTGARGYDSQEPSPSYSTRDSGSSSRGYR
ncbi:hypothetical protein TruAng_005426 [Truncatella angustata]|nr:hypothetical protein TruAng_005426 [Truncatella angustata]